MPTPFPNAPTPPFLLCPTKPTFYRRVPTYANFPYLSTMERPPRHFFLVGISTRTPGPFHLLRARLKTTPSTRHMSTSRSIDSALGRPNSTFSPPRKPPVSPFSSPSTTTPSPTRGRHPPPYGSTHLSHFYPASCPKSSWITQPPTLLPQNGPPLGSDTLSYTLHHRSPFPTAHCTVTATALFYPPPLDLPCICLAPSPSSFSTTFTNCTSPSLPAPLTVHPRPNRGWRCRAQPRTRPHQ